MIGSTKYHGRKCQRRRNWGKTKPENSKGECESEKDRRCVRSKLFIILAAETHLQATVQMERVQSETEEQYDKLQDGASL